MANCLIGFPNRIDAAAISGGGWVPSLPITNFQNRTIGRVARSLDTTLANCVINIDLTKAYSSNIIALVNHNISLNATCRLRGGSDPGFSTTAYDSGWIAVWPIIYPYPLLEWEDDRWWSGKNTADQLGAYYHSLVNILPSAVVARYWRLEISDTSNAAGFIQAGRIFIGPTWQPVKNASYGLTTGWETKTDVQTALGGAEYFGRRVPYRVTKFTLDYLTEDDGMANAFDIDAQAGIDQEVFWVYDPADTVHAQRRQYLGRFQVLNPLQYPVFNTTTKAYEIKELFMTTTVIVNGNTYTDDSDPNTGMGAGGFRTRLLPMVSDVMANMNADLAGANTAASGAAGSAASALAAPGTNGTSITSATIATGSVTITIQPSKTIVVGSSFKIASTASPSNWMHGDVTAYNSATGVLTVNATRIQGSGTFAAWTVSLSGPAFADGAIGGSYQAALSADLALTAASPKLLSLQSASTGGFAAILPDATTLVAGPNAMVVRHSGPASASTPGYDIPLKDHNSNLLGFVQPFGLASLNLPDNTSVGGIWGIGGLMPIGSLAASKITLASACGGTGGTWTKNITLDSTRTLILIYGTSLHAVVYNSSTKLFGAPVLLRAVLSTTGVDATVAAVLVAANSVLVHSVQDGTTALQSVVLSISASVITPGTVVPTTLATAATRIADLITVGAAFVLGLMNGTTAISTVVTTVSGTVPTTGAAISNSTTSPPAIIAWSPTVFTVVWSGTTQVHVTAYSISGVTQNLGSSAASTITTTDSLAMRQVATGNWCVTCINAGAKGTVLSCSGTVPAFSAQVSLSSLVTTINAGGAVMNLSPGSTGAVSSAVSGTDSAGRFVTEFCGWGDSSGSPGTAGLVSGGIIAKGFAASQVAMAMGNLGGSANWVVASAKESALFGFLYVTTNLLLTEYRTSSLDNGTQGLSAPDPLYPKLNLARNTLSTAGTTNNTIGVTDGSQLSLRYDGASYVEALIKPVGICADLRFASKVAGNDAQAWVAFNQAPDLACTIQLMGVA